MGGKRTGQRKQICLCLALLIPISLAACTFSKTTDTKVVGTSFFSTRAGSARQHLVNAQKFLAQGDYANALKENQQVLTLVGNNAPADEALFFIGLIYADPENPTRDIGKSIPLFRRLIKEHPKSLLVEQAKTTVRLLLDNEKLNRSMKQLNLDNDKLNKSMKQLSTVIEELKKVDIQVEERKRRKTK